MVALVASHHGFARGVEWVAQYEQWWATKKAVAVANKRDGEAKKSAVAKKRAKKAKLPCSRFPLSCKGTIAVGLVCPDHEGFDVRFQVCRPHRCRHLPHLALSVSKSRYTLPKRGEEISI